MHGNHPHRRVPRWIPVLLCLCLAGLSTPAFAKGEKVEICHVPPGNPENVKVLSVSRKAMRKHIRRHGDYILEGAVEVCDGRDNNCDREVDEDFPGLGATCFDGLGACRVEGTEVCSLDGNGTVCSAVAGDGTAEVCTGGVDDDCDGATDCGDPDCDSDPACRVPDCGDGFRDPGEECDDPANECCSDTCEIRAGAECAVEASDCTLSLCSAAGTCESQDTDGLSCAGNGVDACSDADTCLAGMCQHNGPNEAPDVACNGLDEDCDGADAQPAGSCSTGLGSVCDAGTLACAEGGGETCVPDFEPECEEIGADCGDVDPMDPCTTCTCVETGCGGRCECETTPQCFALDPSMFPDGCALGAKCPGEAIEYIRNPDTKPSDPCARSTEDTECVLQAEKHPACLWETEYPCFDALEPQHCLEWANGDPYLSMATVQQMCSNQPGCEECQAGCQCLCDDASNQNCQDVFDEWWAKGCPYDVNQEEIEDPSLCTQNNVPNFKDDFTCSPYAFCDSEPNHCRMLPGYPESMIDDVSECCDSLTPYDGTDCAADPAACCDICRNRANCTVWDTNIGSPDDFFYCSIQNNTLPSGIRCEWVVE